MYMFGRTLVIGSKWSVLNSKRLVILIIHCNVVHVVDMVVSR